jgi:hypothetical protein
VLFKLVQVLHATADGRAIIFAHAVYKLPANNAYADIQRLGLKTDESWFNSQNEQEVLHF